jgi:DNA repair protein SbcC/Rad50
MKNGVCPVCDRPAKPSAFKGKKARKDAERKHISKELDLVEERIKTIRGKIERAEEQKETAKELARLRSERSRLKWEIERKELTKSRFEEREALAISALQQLQGKLKELGGLNLEIESVDRNLAKAERGLRSIRDTLVETRGKLENARRRHDEIALEIAAKEDASRRSRKLKEREIWLEDFFVPTVKAIEKSVLATINQEFDSLFKRWFGMLVTEPDKEVGIDEDFTPVVTQSGYEQDVRYLSGGERTSVALAYRLSLNILAQRVSAGMKSNLLILDEPTDGFSKEQLGNVREVLDEVGSPQVIIVSHDKELESFADQIFRVGKKGTESVVGS